MGDSLFSVRSLWCGGSGTIRGQADIGLRPVTYDRTWQVTQNLLRVVSGVDLTLHGATQVMAPVRPVVGSVARKGAGADARNSVRSGQQVRPVSLLTIGVRGRPVAIGDHTVTVECRGTRGTHLVTGLRGGASGHADLCVRSSRRMPSEGVTASLARGDINRSVG
jgi:hypothetical protein